MHLNQIPGSVLGTSAAPMGSAPLAEAEKVQWIRLLDMGVIGPSMIFTGLALRPPAWVRAGMMIAGVATIFYNLNNFMTIQRQKQAALQSRET